MKIIKVPIPGSPVFAMRTNPILDVLDLAGEITADTNLVHMPDGRPQTRMSLSMFLLVDELGPEEDHKFALVLTGDSMPAGIGGEITYVSTAAVTLPGGTMEFHLFHAGPTDEIDDKDLEMYQPAVLEYRAGG